MINVTEARNIILQTVRDFGVEAVGLDDAIGRVLREAFIADREFPPYDRVTMDGIAIKTSSFAKEKKFKIQGVAPAGAPMMQLEEEHGCLEVMTGAILPAGTDAVIRYEDLHIENGQATINLEAVKLRQNVHGKGTDRSKGSLVVKPGKALSPAEIGVAATIGKAQVQVSRLPTCMIISTGDELVQVEEQPLPYQIRRSNVHRLLATLRQFNIHAVKEHLVDDLETIKLRLKEILTQYDVVILSGGVSKGKFDYLPEALESLGVKKLFHKIKQRPGKPFWFGQAPSGALIFALPGNPVSSFMCTQIYFLEWLELSLGLAPSPVPHGILQAPLHFKPDLTYFAQVKISYNEQGQILATPVEGHGSGDLANLVDADAFMEIPRGRTVFETGERFPLFFYR